MDGLKKYKYRKGSYVYIEGDEEVDTVYIVESGEIIFRRLNERIQTTRQSAGPGDIFGFISSLSDRPRMESAVAMTDSIVLAFTRERFITLLQKKSSIALKVINYFVEELRAYDDMIFHLFNESEEESPEIGLYRLGEFYFQRQMPEFACYVLQMFASLYPSSDYNEDIKKMQEKLNQSGKKFRLEPVREGGNLLFTDRQIIFCEHEPGTELYVIKEGKVKIIKQHDEAEVMLSVLRQGDIFGEMALVSNKPRNATAVSFGRTVLLALNKESLLRLMSNSPEMLRKIYTSISQRIWFTFIRLESRLYEKPLTRIYVFLENKLLEDNISLKNGKPHIFHFGIDELLKMNNLSQEMLGESMNELLRDQNLCFNFGEIEVENPANVASKARYYKSRDHLSSSFLFSSAGVPARDVPKETPHEIKEAPAMQETAPRPPKVDKQDLEFPVESSAEMNSELFNQLSDELALPD